MVTTNLQRMSGIFSALITPMNSDGQIQYFALEELIEAQLSDGVEGFYVCGSSGEALLLSISERKMVLNAVQKAVAGRVPVIAHVGTIRTDEAIDLARHAADAGVDAVSLIPPYYYHFTMEEILGYYEDVASAVPGLPIIVYNIPQFTGVSFNKDNAARLLDNPQVIGIHTSQNLYDLERIRNAYPNKILFNGFDEQFLAALSMGADATIGTTVNVFAPLFVHLRQYFLKGNIKAAHTQQALINVNIEAMLKIGIFNAVKYACTVRGIECGSCRAPFRPLSDQDKDIVRSLLG
jgi:N-acetylneuraminate lyase